MLNVRIAAFAAIASLLGSVALGNVPDGYTAEQTNQQVSGSCKGNLTYTSSSKREAMGVATVNPYTANRAITIYLDPGVWRATGIAGPGQPTGQWKEVTVKLLVRFAEGADIRKEVTISTRTGGSLYHSVFLPKVAPVTEVQCVGIEESTMGVAPKQAAPAAPREFDSLSDVIQYNRERNRKKK